MRQYWQDLNACYSCGGIVDRYAVYCAHCGELADRNPRVHFGRLPQGIAGMARSGPRDILINTRTKRKARGDVIRHEVAHVRGIDRAARLPRWARGIYRLFFHKIYVDFFLAGFHVIRGGIYSRLAKLRWVCKFVLVLGVPTLVLAVLLFTLV